MKIAYSNSSIGSVAALAKMLDVTENFLTLVASKPDDFYSISKIPKKTDGFRTISDPVKELKIVQRRIVRRIFSKCSFPSYLFGSIRDEINPRDFVRNAQYHSQAREVMAFDVESFFPSVRPQFVKKVLKFLFNLPNEVAEMLVSLMTLQDGLPQGAPTSSYVANLIFYDCEHKIVKTLNAMGFTYSRLVDDITVSSKTIIKNEERRFIYEQISKMLGEKKLKISQRKYGVTNTTVIGKKTVVTGLVVEDKMIKLPKEKVKLIGQMVYELKSKAEVSTTDHEYHKSFNKASGLVALYSRLNTKKAEIHRQHLRQILPTYDNKKAKKIGWLCRKFIGYSKLHPSKFSEEGYTRKYYKFKHKISILSRTNRTLAISLEKDLKPLKPTCLLASFHE
ncbi:reverse transcriptase family protein [Collimonas fungivorans]|uniref:Retron reverse transcriptase n=1 Tax=Collimonas fungivorans (strain Ter331) TaxID=1005048 RepID=G0AC57_COLFT|nr:reverse transcriptase family protein [Collimonas fungivorans]AEK62412.1 retron reverse transcriptase [Collimonas fungivorans Ter331]